MTVPRSRKSLGLSKEFRKAEEFLQECAKNQIFGAEGAESSFVTLKNKVCQSKSSKRASVAMEE